MRARGPTTSEPIEDPLERYHTDFGRVEWRRPRTVIRAKTVEEVQRAVAGAHRAGTRVGLRGHACSSAGMCLSDELLVDLTGLDEIQVRSSSLVTVGAGVRWTPLQEHLVQRNLSSMVFGDSPAATIGGLLSVGGFGSASPYLGAAIHHVKALDVVIGTGELVRAEPSGEHAELFRYALGGLGQVGVIVRADMALKPYRPYLVLHARSFPSATSVDEINAFLESRQPWDQAFITFDVGTKLWRALWARTEDERVGLRGAPLGAAVGFGLSHRLAPMMGFPTVAPDLAPITTTGKLLRRLMGSGERRDWLQRKMEDAVEAAPNGIAIKHAHRFFNQGAESFVSSLVDANLRAGRVRDRAELRNVWNDYFVPTPNADAFFSRVRPLIDDPVTTRGFWGTIIYNPGARFSELPLSPIPPAERVNTFGPYCLVDPGRLDDYRRRYEEAQDTCHALGGRVYLFGYHPKKEAFYRRQFGDAAVDGWKAAKRRYDPGAILGPRIFD